MIQLVVQRLVRRRNVREIHYPPSPHVHFASDMDLDSEAVPMKPGALVTLGNKREPMGSFERELLEDLGLVPLRSRSDGDLAVSRQLVEIDRVHTPVVSFHAMT